MGPPLKVFALGAGFAALLIQRSAPSYALGGSITTLAISLFLLQVLAYSTWSIVLYPKFFSPLRHLPTPKGGSFFMGQFSRIFKEPSGHPASEWLKTVPNDGVIRYTHAFNAERLLVTSPKALAEVLVHKNYDFIKTPQLREGLGRLLGIGILLAEGDEHKRQRKSLSPAFSYRHTKDLYPLFWTKAREATRMMQRAITEPKSVTEKPNSIVEISAWASRATLDIIGVAGMGQDFGAIQDPESKLNKTYAVVFKPTPVARLLGTLNIFFPGWLISRIPIKRNDDIRTAAEVIRTSCRDLIQAKKSARATGAGHSEVDILSVALDSGGFTDENLVDQLMTFLAAGHETTATSMTWATLLLCQHPEVCTRLRNEIRAALPSILNSDDPVTDKDIEGIPYLHAVCNEVLRFYPPVPITVRIAAHDTSILGNFVPKGTTIILCPYAINRDTTLWGPDANTFNPDRWMGQGKANSGGAASNYAFMTFLHGPRSCIGQGFAKAEFACLLAAWVGVFDGMELADPEKEIQTGGGITAKPKGGLEVRLSADGEW